MKLWIIWTAVFFLGGTKSQFSNTLRDPDICGRPVCKGGGKFRYNPGTSFYYEYSVNVTSTFQGTSKNESTLFITCDVNLDFLSNCEGILTLSNARLSERQIVDVEGSYEYVEPSSVEEEEVAEPIQTQSELFSEALSEFSLRFSFQDGVITELCPFDEEKNWVLNFKRGLLSLFHNTMKRFDLDHESLEEDVKGRCKTSYKIQGAKETSLVIEKTKNLDTCEGRSKLHSIVQSTPYTFRPNYQAVDLLKSKTYCELSVDHHIYNDITCEETHLFRPFSNKAAGATTVVKQKLHLVEEKLETPSPQNSVYRRTSLLFDQVPTPKPTIAELKTSRDLMKKLCKMTSDDVQMDFSDVFTTFIHIARILNVPTLNALYKHSETICPTGRKHILDALPYLGSSASVALMKDIILQDGVPQSTVNEWMMAIALIPRPDTSIMDSVQELLSGRIDNVTVALGVASLTYTYCKQNEGCEYEQNINGIISLLETMTTQAYRSEPQERTNRQTQETMIVGLKALSNIGHVSDDTKEVFMAMIKDKSLNVAIRIAAVEAHRRLPCGETRPFFENTFKDQDENTEVRIASYLQVMRCPNYVVLRGIIHTLEIEEVNQVGSFVWSHLHNLLKSSVPERVEIQGLLSDKDLKKKFSGDARKFSQNFEGSMFFEEFNVGSNYDVNLIYATDSYIPRSLSMNVSVELFGESINFLETYGRFEGFEHYLESLFGPKGKFSSKNLQDNLNIPKMRWSRSVKDNEVLDAQVETLPNIPKNAFGDPKISLGMKVFGNELKYNTFSGDEEIKEGLGSLNPINYIKRILSGKEINYSKAAMFLDCSYVIPTGAGLPLSLSAIGTSSVNMMMSGELHAPNFRETGEFDIKGNLKPSVAIDVVGTMAVDAFYASTAIKLKTNVYSSSAVEGNIKIRGSELVNIKFSLPLKTTEIFGAKSELIVVKDGKEQPQEGVTKNKVSQNKCSWEAVEKTVGLNLCGSYHFSNVTKEDGSAYFVLAGPAGARVFIQKSDPSAKTYILEYKKTLVQGGSVMSLTFETPGSDLKRLLTANITSDEYTKNLTFLVESTSGTIMATGKYKNTPAEKHLQFDLTINDQKNFDVFVSLTEAPIANGILYVPKLSIGVNSERIAELEGSVKYVSKLSVSQYDVDLKFKTKRMTSKLFGYLLKTEASIGADLKLEYVFVNTKEQKVALYFLLANRSKSMIVTILGNAVLEATAYPNVNFNATLKFQKGQGHVDTQLVVVSTPHLRENRENDKKKITLELSLNYRGLSNSTRFNVSGSLKRPINNLDLGASFTCNMIDHNIDVITSIRYARNKDIVISAFYSHPRQTLEYREGRLNITVPGTAAPMILRGKIKEKSDKNYLVEFSGSWFSGHSIEAKGIYQDKCTGKAAHHHLKLLLRSPSFQEINSSIQFFRDDYVFKFDIKAEQNKENYGLFLKHAASSPVEMSSQVRLKYKTKIYSLNSSLSLREKREVRLELHLDQLRDVHLAVWAHKKPMDILAGFEIKWDANRDPNQKLMVTLDLMKPGPWHAKADLMVSYPGRNINAVYEFLLKEGHFSTMARISWSVDLSFAIQLVLDYHLQQEQYVQGRLEVITPFEESRRNALIVKYHHLDNMYNVSGLLFWHQNQRISIDIFGDYSSNGEDLRCEYKAGISSTVADIPSIGASIKHYHNESKVDTSFKVTYKPKQIIAITSVWQIDEDFIGKNLTGTVTMMTPFKGFNRGLLVSKVYLTNTRDIRAVADLDIDHKKFTTSLEGHFRRLSNCMLVFNITTPLGNFNKIIGRFGFSEENRHLVAMVHYPKGVVGVEVLLQIESIGNFDTKFELATPVEFLQEILVVGKFKSDRVDFRVGWNKLTVGFAGIWHFEEITNFEYSYKVFTPLDGYEENGLVVKFIYEEGLDTEISARLAGSKVGVLILLKPKPKVLQEMGIKTQGIYLDKLSTGAIKEDEENENAEDENYDDEEEEEDPLSWAGMMVVDALVYPTVKGELDIEQKGTLYVLLGTLKLPEGQAQLRNEFDFIDIYTMRNNLLITTPFHECKEITSSYVFELRMNEMYLFGFDFGYKFKNRWISSGARIHLEMEDDVNSFYNATIHLHTPMESFPKLDIHGSLQNFADENLRTSNFSMITQTNNISFIGYLEMDESLLKTNVAFHVLSPVLTFPPIHLDFKKEFTNEDKRVDFILDIFEAVPNRYKLESMWKYNSIRDFKASMLLTTPLKGLEKTEIAAEVVASGRDVLAKGLLILNPVNINVNSSIIDNTLNATAIMELNKKRRDIALVGRIITIDTNRHDFKGELVTEKITYDVTGNIFTDESIPLDMKFDVRPKKGGSPITVAYNFQRQPQGHAVKCNIRQGHNYGTLELHSTIKHEMDWDIRLRLDSNHPQYKTFNFQGKAETIDGKNNTISFSCRTSLPKLEHPRLTASYIVDGEDKQANIVYDIAETKGQIQTFWTWVMLEKMTVKLLGHYEAPNYRRDAAINAFYINPKKAFDGLKVGGYVKLNNTWLMGTNLTLNKFKGEKIEVIGNVDVPHPNKETHTFIGKLHAQNDLTHIIYLGQYNTLNSKSTYSSSGDINFGQNEHKTGQVDVVWDKRQFNTFVDYASKDNITNFLWKLKTPKFKEETIITKLKYQPKEKHHDIWLEFYYPESRPLVRTEVKFQEFSNMNGNINITNPFRGVNYTHVHFLSRTTALIYDRYIKLSWPKDNAFLNSTCRTTMGKSALDSFTKGVIIVEVPLTTRHKGVVDYTYSQKQQNTAGDATVKYNEDKLVEGKYTCVSQSRAGFEKDVIHVEVKNPFMPVGADYVHGFEYSSPGKGSNLPTLDSKYVHLYHLTNKTAFNITGGLNITTKSSGQAIALMANHSNRTVKFWTNYDVIDQVFKHHSKLELAQKQWFSYDLNLINKTTDDLSEAQEIQIDVSYPKRNFTIISSYNLTQALLTSDVSLKYHNDHPRIVQAQFDWKKDESHPNKQEVQLIFKHPSFSRDVLLLGEYSSAGRTLMDVGLTVDYSIDLERLVKIRSLIENHSDEKMLNYTYNLMATHPATALDLDAKGGVFLKYSNNWYHTKHVANYARSYMPVITGELSGLFDFINNEIELKKKSVSGTTYLRGKYQGDFPVYRVNMSAIYKDLNANGEFYLSFDENLIKLDLNTTEDGSKSTHMLGYIPDSRNAVFDYWREDGMTKETDVSYYLRLNHSRLIVAKLIWKPDLKQAMQAEIQRIAKDVYNDTIDDFDYWRNYARIETVDVITDIWKNAKPLIQDFLDDVRDLSVIEEDFEELKTIANESYYRNEFYVQDIERILVYVVDELALRSHIESLPAIVNEIWEVMGESGKKIQKSILWIIETIKLYYKNATEFIHGLIQGESLEHLSEAFNHLIEKYDNMIKEIHVSFIKYMEKLWEQTYLILVDHWHKTLAALEPTFIEFLHYLESFVWNTGNDLLDFLYVRQAAMMESPYFTKFTNFTHDLDKFYKDMTGNDTIGASLKYTKVAYEFLKEKYFTLVPFAGELNDVVMEIVNEIKQLAKLPSVSYFLQKMDEANANVKWWIDYFELEEKFHWFVTVVHMKMTDMKQTALEAENKYRKPKTKFIYDPYEGIMYLEQKLPMSWHAFNETPKFEEIPEYKMINDIQTYFSSSKVKYNSFYYDYKPYTDPSDWLPPFKGQALLAGSRHFITFDRVHYDFQGTCSYLLASDFIDRNFSIAISSKTKNKKSHHELIVLHNKTVIHIDVFENRVLYGNDKKSKLPVQIGSAYLYQEADIVTLESANGFVLQCNMKFDVCSLEVSGWYFGKTAGLWGTMNNEPSDDLLTSGKTRAQISDVDSFAKSWALDYKCKHEKTQEPQSKNVSESIRNLCEVFFKGKMSPFLTCFQRVPSEPFLEMCLNSASRQEVCTSAVAYMNLCAYENTPLRIPEECITCNLVNGTTVPEGKIVTMDGKEVPQSADVVFIVEAKACNKDLRKNRNMDSVIEHINKELVHLKITHNRYGVILFGGDGVFDSPRSVVLNNEIFTDHNKITSYFESLPIGDGNADIFGAITYATKLVFRPGVSKTFILIPCSHCYESDMKLDHAILNLLLLENDIKMHILMNDDFQLQKSRMAKILYGIDQTLAYTRKDADNLTGDPGLRRQVRVPKSSLGICAPLALEIHGSVFSAKKLENNTGGAAKKLATVFGKRVAKSATPSKCKKCECSAHNTGVSYMDCYPCNFPMSGGSDLEFNEEDMLVLMNKAYDDIMDYD